MERAWEDLLWSPRENSCKKMNRKLVLPWLKFPFLSMLSSTIALLPSSRSNTFNARPTRTLLSCSARSVLLVLWEKSLQQRELKKDKLYIIKFLCSLPVVEDCHGNIFFNRINFFSVNNVHRAKGENILFIYKNFIGDTFFLAPNNCKCFICCVLNHYEGGYYLSLKSSGSWVFVWFVVCLGFFISLKP